jgi:hypothetical protein
MFPRLILYAWQYKKNFIVVLLIAFVAFVSSGLILKDKLVPRRPDPPKSSPKPTSFTILRRSDMVLELTNGHGIDVMSSNGWAVSQIDSQSLFYYYLSGGCPCSAGSVQTADTLFVPQNKYWRVAFDHWGELSILGSCEISYVPVRETDTGVSHIHLKNGSILMTICGRVEITAGKYTIRNIASPFNTDTTRFKVSLDSTGGLEVASEKGLLSISDGISIFHVNPDFPFSNDRPPFSDHSGTNTSKGKHLDSHTFVLTGKKFPQILAEIALYYGVKGYKCGPGIDTSQANVWGIEHLQTAVPLATLLKVLSETFQMDISMVHDSIVLRKKPYVNAPKLKAHKKEDPQPQI